MELEQAFAIIQSGKPALRFCERFSETDELWNFSRHSHPYIELMYFLDGAGTLEVSGTHMHTVPFDTVVYPAGWEHQEAFSADKPREIICLWVELPELQLEEPIQFSDTGNQMSALFQAIHQEAKRGEPEPLILENYMKILLMKTLRDGRRSMSDESFVNYVLQYLHANYTQHITLEQLSEMVYVSTSYLSRQFKKRIGMTVISYLNALRIETAKGLLAFSDINVNEIAYQVGFDSPKYFYRKFRAMVGESPASFRKQFRE